MRYYNPENSIKLEKVECGILELKVYVLPKLYMVKSTWQTHGNKGRGQTQCSNPKPKNILIFWNFE